MYAEHSTDHTGYTFDTSKKLVVTISTTNFALKADGVKRTVGVIVEDYSSKPAGEYEDEITYTVEVQSAGLSQPNMTATVTGAENSCGGNRTFYYTAGETWRHAITKHPTENPGWSDGASISGTLYQ